MFNSTCENIFSIYECRCSCMYQNNKALFVVKMFLVSNVVHKNIKHLIQYAQQKILLAVRLFYDRHTNTKTDSFYFQLTINT